MRPVCFSLGAAALALAVGVASGTAGAQILEYGDRDVLGTGTYASDPTAGATLVGLAPGVVTAATLITGHGFPFDPAPGDFAGTDQIYIGSAQSGFSDGYSGHVGRIAGPQSLSLNYASLVPLGEVVQTFTLGIAFDDFQQTVFGQPFIVRVNGVDFAPLSTLASSLGQTGPVVQFFTIGLDPALLTADHTLSITIDQGGAGSDGWAIDFLTVGVTTIPSPGSAVLVGLGLAVAGRRRR